MADLIIETREVLGDAYLGPNKRSGRMLSHACEVDAPKGEVITVLCGRVSPLSMADYYAGDATATPTCERCQRALRRREREHPETPTEGDLLAPRSRFTGRR